MTLALKIKQLREQQNISQYKLAHDLKISQSTVGMWESGKREPSLGLMLALSSYFGVSIDNLLGKSSYKIPSDDRIAKLLADKPEMQKLADQICMLNREQTLKALDYIQLLLLQQEQEQEQNKE